MDTFVAGAALCYFVLASSQNSQNSQRGGSETTPPANDDATEDEPNFVDREATLDLGLRDGAVPSYFEPMLRDARRNAAFDEAVRTTTGAFVAKRGRASAAAAAHSDNKVPSSSRPRPGGCSGCSLGQL